MLGVDNRAYISTGWYACVCVLMKGRQPARTPALLAGLALIHALLFAWLVPPWQAPDEPTLFEYAALVARLGRVPTTADNDPALERQIVDSLVRQRFFEYLTGQPPARPPRSLADVREAFFLPPQLAS